MPFSSRSHAQTVVERLDVRTGHSTLDLGCGDGSYLRSLADATSRRVVGLDLSLSSLGDVSNRKAAWEDEAASRISLLCGDAARLPLADCTFDRVVFALVLYLVPIEESLKELARILATGGKAYVRVPMLSWGRTLNILQTSSLRRSAYAGAHVVSGVLFAMTGRQRRNFLLRNDQWALHVPRKRLCSTIAKVGLSIERMEITTSVSGAPSIEAWLVKS